MRIRSIEVNNFKSLVGFELQLQNFSCLVGLNGVGKSSVLQFFDFLSQLMRGNMKGWFEERQWKPTDVRSKFLKKMNVEFCVRFQDESGQPCGRWEGHYNPSQLRCTWERMDLLDYVLEIESDEIRIEANLLNVRREANQTIQNWKSSISFSYEGSILSALKEKVLPESIIECRTFFQCAESLDTLTPERLRQRTKNANGTLGHGGRNLSAFVYELGPTGRLALAKQLAKAYPQLKQIESKSLRSGWKQLEAAEHFHRTKLLTEARHLNDGLLRLIAILAEVKSKHGFLLFDEIENGINPELVEFVIDILVKAEQQIVVTTHSPMILNYLDDAIAKKGIVYIYRTKEGYTKSIPLFSIPSLKKKLEVMGPGEAFVDTNLTELATEISQLPEEVK